MTETPRPTDGSARSSPEGAPIQPKWQSGVLFVLVLLLASNLALLHQNRALKRAPDNAPAASRFLQVGEEVPPFHGITPSGRVEIVEYDGSHRTLLFVLSPQCTWCLLNIPYWRAIETRLRDDETRIVAVSTTPGDLEGYMAEHELSGLPILGEPDPGDLVTYKLDLTPQTLLIGPGGVVERVWPGVIRPEQVAGMEAALGIDLSDIDPIFESGLLARNFDDTNAGRISREGGIAQD